VEQLFPVVHEDADLLVINKPADLVCHPTKSGVYSSLIGRIRLYLGQAVRPQLINRLDRETSGLVLVAKNAAAASELRKLWERREVDKRYLAIVHGHMAESQGTIDAPVGKDEKSVVAIKGTVRPDGAAARTAYTLLRAFTRNAAPFSLLRVEPLTGRKHQIRIHLSHLGHPIVGDKLYGPDERLYLAFVEKRLTESERRQLILPNHALHAGEVAFSWRGEAQLYRADPEPWFDDFIHGA
jgi:23S rRNA pseudouridine1911/1915/1917 synthase